LDFIKKHFNDLEFTEKEIIKTLQLINWHQINLNGFDPSFYRNFIKRFYSPNKEVYNRFIRDWVNVRICDYAGRIHFDERKTSSVHDFMDFVESPETQEFLNQPLNELEIFDKELIILSGISYSGKSTIANKIQSNYGHVIVSSDDELVRLAVGMSYNEAFSKLQTDSSFKNKHRVNLENSFYNAMKENKNIIIDQTNLTKKTRRWKIHEAKKRGYKVKSIVVLATSPMVVDRQHDRSNKFISSAVLDNQRRIFSLPSYDEGFDEIEFNFDSF
jgi:predicted kinase